MSSQGRKWTAPSPFVCSQSRLMWSSICLFKYTEKLKGKALKSLFDWQINDETLIYHQRYWLLLINLLSKKI